MKKHIPDQEFIDIWRKLRSPAGVARHFNLDTRSVYHRRRNLEARYGITLDSEAKPAVVKRQGYVRCETSVEDGVVIVFSDAHYWPGIVSLAHRALLACIEGLKPKMIVANGDIFDGASISRHDRIGWDSTPTVKQELEACKERMAEIEKAAGGNCRLFRTIGNHDIRFERKLAMDAAAFEGVEGFTLQDHLPSWEPGWSLMVNGHTMIKHRFNNGVHAAYNNTLKAGTSIVTGHLHRLCITPWGDYNGRRWGVDTGTLADPNGPQFAYSEDAPSPHCAGFAVLTFDKEGTLLPPELVEVFDGRAHFRGHIICQDD